MEYYDHEERHKNAIDLRLQHIGGNQYAVPSEWTPGVKLVVDLSGSGKSQLRIMQEVARQLAVKAAQYMNPLPGYNCPECGASSIDDGELCNDCSSNIPVFSLTQ